MSGSTVKAWWFDPRSGKAKAIGEFPRTGSREFIPPDEGENLDWILVLDDASRKFPAPDNFEPTNDEQTANRICCPSFVVRPSSLAPGDCRPNLIRF